MLWSFKANGSYLTSYEPLVICRFSHKIKKKPEHERFLCRPRKKLMLHAVQIEGAHKTTRRYKSRAIGHNSIAPLDFGPINNGF